jgi:hypothetical protein
VQRLRARVAGDGVGLEAAARRFRDLELPFHLALAVLEHAEPTESGESLAEDGALPAARGDAVARTRVGARRRRAFA